MPKICTTKAAVAPKKRKTVDGKALRKKAEKELDGLWGDIIRKRGGGKCAWPGCGRSGNQPHHFFHRAQGNVARWSTDNGCLLCFGHHIRQVHQKGDTEPLRDVLIARLGEEGFDRLKADVRRVWRPTLEEIMALEEKFEKELHDGKKAPGLNVAEKASEAQRTKKMLGASLRRKTILERGEGEPTLSTLHTGSAKHRRRL